jgi:hypothetical protein
MMTKRYMFFSVSLLVMTCLALSVVAKPGTSSNIDKPVRDLHGGNHVGEVRQLEVDIAFTGSYGETVTDEYGTFYHIWGHVYYEDKTYTPEYWGVFPLYFFDTQVGVNVTVKNLGPRKKANLRVRTEAYCLNTDGTSGVELTPKQEHDVSLELGEEASLDCSFMAEYVEGADSGLDRLIVKILHPNNGGGPGNSDPALIMMKEAIFCPPENEGEILEILEQILAE